MPECKECWGAGSLGIELPGRAWNLTALFQNRRYYCVYLFSIIGMPHSIFTTHIRTPRQFTKIHLWPASLKVYGTYCFSLFIEWPDALHIWNVCTAYFILFHISYYFIYSSNTRLKKISICRISIFNSSNPNLQLSYEPVFTVLLYFCGFICVVQPSDKVLFSSVWKYENVSF